MAIHKARSGYRHPKPDRRPDTLWLKAQIEKSAMSHFKIASRLDLDPPKFSRILSGGRKIEIPKFVELAAMLDVPLALLLEKLGYPAAARTIRSLRIT